MRRRRSSDASRLNRGGGTGCGKDFIPFIKTRDVPSQGLSHRILGIKTGRIHHLLSNLEKAFFLILDFSPCIIDIREQFPLPLQDTLDICRRFRLRHPAAGNPLEPIIMTTDFLINNFHDGRHSLRAITVKPASKLSRRTLEKFEIERIYWFERGVEWGIIIDTDLPKVFCRNLDWLHAAYYPSRSQQYPCEIKTQVEYLLYKWSHTFSFTPFTTLTRNLDQQLGLPSGSSLWLTRHFLATGIWSTDLSVPLRLDKPLAIRRKVNTLELVELAA